MTPNEFRKIALGFPQAVESAHMQHPDFRVNGKIFATLGYPDSESAVVKLKPETQRLLVHSQPKTFEPAPGAWGRRGNTRIHLPAANSETVRQAIAEAWRSIAPKSLRKNEQPD
jgi:hypothetical protein